MNIFKHEFLYTVYADGTTFFLKDRKSIAELMSELNTFSKSSGLKPNNTKCEIASICVMEAKSSNSCINLLLINLCICFYHVWGLFFGKCNYLLSSDHATLIFNIILTFYFSLFKTQSFSYKFHIIKTLFANFGKFTILFSFKIKQLKYVKTLNT